ncbi:MAG: formate dehydrogenase accessory protein FdhE [Pseudomonadota bacterium]|nr:formate dehydrogenase accessory protein FdhE [Pseudomonadota bacterium]
MTTTRLLTPEEIALRAGQNFARLRTPEADVFAQRALRLRQLAAGHAMRDYLMFIAQLAEAQDRALQSFPAVPLPSAQQLQAAAQSGQPALAVSAWPRDVAWQSSLRTLLEQLADALPADSPARASVQAVRALPADKLNQQADRLLTGVMLGLDFAAAPLIAAGLQVYFTHLVRATQAAHAQNRPAGADASAHAESAWGYAQDATRCPCCGSLPTASITRIGGDADGYRYLHCSVCNAQWHMVRVKCTHCESTQGIHYQSLQAADTPSTPEGKPTAVQDTVQAETCDSCGHYLKIVRLNKDPHAEPAADDLATLTLDLLVSEAGFARHGVNLMLLFGEGDTPESGSARA